MVTSDPIADMLTRIRNALLARKLTVDVPSSKMKLEIARVLQEEGYILGFDVDESGVYPVLVIQLKYYGSRRERRPVLVRFGDYCARWVRGLLSSRVITKRRN